MLKWLNPGFIYAISNSHWVSPVHVVPKKDGFIVIMNERNELIPIRTVTGWRVCIDYIKLNTTTRKDHFPLPFIDQILDRLAGHPHFCFLDGYSGYNQIIIAPEDQEKTTFTCPYGTFSFRRIPFGLCNAPATFQRCMMSMFSYLAEEVMEIFMDDFTVYGTLPEKFGDSTSQVARQEYSLELGKMPFYGNRRHCPWAQNFYSRAGSKLSPNFHHNLLPPTTVKGIRSFLGHVGFYRRFIRDFSKIARPLCRLLEKDTKFNFDESCQSSFERSNPD